MVDSVYLNSGRGCINCSGIWASRHTEKIAAALAERLGPVRSAAAGDPKAGLAAFTVPGVAQADLEGDRGRPEGGGRDRRDRQVRPAAGRKERCAYLRPTVVHCESPETRSPRRNTCSRSSPSSSARRSKMLEAIGPTLVCTAITERPDVPAAIDRRDAHRPAEHRPDPDDQARLAAAARRQHRRVPVPRRAYQSAQGTAGHRTVECRADAEAGSVGCLTSWHAAWPLPTRGVGHCDVRPPRHVSLIRNSVLPRRESSHDSLRLSTAHADRLRPGKIDSLGDLAGELGARRALVGQRSGHRRRPAMPSTGSTRCAAPASRRTCSTASTRTPPTDNVDAGLAVARRYEPELIVGLGGGSSMDCAKGINFLYSNGGRMQDYWGVGKATRADAADDRRAHHRRHRQRDPVVRADLRRQDARQDGLRRQEGLVPRRPTRSRRSPSRSRRA